MKNKKILAYLIITLLCVGSYALGQISAPTDAEWREIRKIPMLDTMRIVQSFNRGKDINSINVLKTCSENIQREKELIYLSATTPRNSTEVRQYCILSIYLPIK